MGGVRALLGSVHTLLQTVVPIWPKSILVQPSGFAFEPEPEGHVSVIMDPQGQAHGRRAASYAPPTVRVESGEFPSTVSWSSRAPSAHGLERGSIFQSFQTRGGACLWCKRTHNTIIGVHPIMVVRIPLLIWG